MFDVNETEDPTTGELLPYVLKKPTESAPDVPVAPVVETVVAPAQDVPGPSESAKPLSERDLIGKYLMEKMQKDQEDADLVRSSVLRSQGYKKNEETGKWEEPTGLAGLGFNLSDAQRNAINQGVAGLNTNVKNLVTASKYAQPWEAPKGDVIKEGLPQTQQAADALAKAGMGKQAGLAGYAGYLKEQETERQRKQSEDPTSDQSRLMDSALKEVAPEVWARVTDGGKKQISAADAQKTLDTLGRYGLGLKKIAADKSTAANRDDLARQKLALAIARANQASYRINSDTNEIYDSKGALVLPQDVLNAAHFGQVTVPGGAAKAAQEEADRELKALPRPGGVGGPSAPKTETGVSAKTTALSDKFSRDLDATQGRSGISMKNASEVKRRAMSIRATYKDIQPDNTPKEDPTPFQLAETAIQLNSLLTGRVGGSNAEFKKLLPEGFEISKANLEQWFSSQPERAKAKQWVKTFLDLTDREAKTADDFVKETIAAKVPGNGAALRKRDPKQYETIMVNRGLDPDAFDDRGKLISGDYTIKPLPRVDPAARAKVKEGNVLVFNYKTGAYGQMPEANIQKPWVKL